MNVIRAPNGEFTSVDLTNVYPYWRKLDYTERSDPDTNEYVLDYPTTGSKSRLVNDKKHADEIDARDIVVPSGSVVDLTSNENYRACQEIPYERFGFTKIDWLAGPALCWTKLCHVYGLTFHPSKYQTIHVLVDPKDKVIIIGLSNKILIIEKVERYMILNLQEELRCLLGKNLKKIV